MWPRRMLQTWSARLKERAMNLLSMEQNGGVVVIYYFVSSDLYEMATGRLSASLLQRCGVSTLSTCEVIQLLL